MSKFGKIYAQACYGILTWQLLSSLNTYRLAQAYVDKDALVDPALAKSQVAPPKLKNEKRLDAYTFGVSHGYNDNKKCACALNKVFIDPRKVVKDFLHVKDDAFRPIGVGEQVSLSTLIDEAKAKYQEQVLLEFDVADTDDNHYLMMPIKNLVDLEKHSRESQYKLGLKNVPIKLADIEGSKFDQKSFTILLEPRSIGGTMEEAFFTVDHETVHAKQETEHLLGGLKQWFWNGGSMLAGCFGINIPNPTEEDADLRGVLLNNGNLKGAFQSFMPNNQIKPLNIKEFKDSYDADSAAYVPGPHKPHIERLENIVRFQKTMHLTR